MFVTIVATFVAGAIAGAFVPVIVVLAENHGQFEDQQQFVSALRDSFTHAPVLLASGAVTQFVILVGALAAAILSPVALVRRLRLNRSTLPWLGYILAPIGALAVGILFGSLVTLLHIHPGGTLRMMDEAFRKLTPTELVLAVLIVGVAPAFAEEFLFRGYAQTRFVQRWGRWPGILLTAFLFGLMHMDLIQSPFALGFGIYLGYLAEKSGSIRPTMVCHGFNNSLQVVGAWAAAQSGHTGDPSTSQTLFMTFASAAVLTACVLYIRFRVHPPAENLPPPIFPAGPMFPPPPAPVFAQ